MVGFDVTCDGARAPGAFSHHYRWKPAIVHGAKGGCQRGGPGSPVIYPASALWRQAKKQRGARGGHSPSRAGWKMAKIMLAEDDNDMRRFLVKALQNAGYDVISFDNGLSAYQRLREEPFELLLTDIVMPEMDG